MFDYQNAMRKPLAGGMDVQSSFAPPAPVTPFMEMPPPQAGPQQGGGMNANSMQSLMGLGTALGNRIAAPSAIKGAGATAGSTAGKSVGAFMVKKRPVDFGSPHESGHMNF